jgi:hypothetical protein
MVAGGRGVLREYKPQGAFIFNPVGGEKFQPHLIRKRGLEAMLSGGDSHGEDVVAADFEFDAWKRTRRRPGENGSIGDRE